MLVTSDTYSEVSSGIYPLIYRTCQLNELKIAWKC